MRKLIAACLLLATGAYVWAQIAPVPALPDTERRTEYAGVSGSAGPFNVGFALYGDGSDYQNWVQVYVNGVLTTAWSMSSPSGTLGNIPLPITNAQITFSNAQTGTVEIVGARRPRRLSQLAENRPFSAHDFNVIVTDLVAQLREGWDARQNRVVQVPPGDTQVMLPPKAARANQAAIFDPNGNLTPGLPVAGSVPVSSAMQPVVACATIACAQGMLGVTPVPIATVLPYAGLQAPANFDFAAGQQYSRANFQALMNALTSSQTGTCTSGSTTISGLADTSQLGAGQKIEGSRIPSLANTVQTVVNATTITVLSAATSSGSCTVQIFPYGNGDGITTFNLPDFRSVSPMGRGNMGGTDRGLVTAQYFGVSPTGLGLQGGAQNHTMTINELVQHAHVSEDASTGVTVASSVTNNTNNWLANGGAHPAGLWSGGGGATDQPTISSVVTDPKHHHTIDNTGNSAPFPSLGTRTVSNYIIRVVP